MGGLSLIKAQDQESWKTALTKGFLSQFYRGDPDAAATVEQRLIELFDAIEMGHSCIALPSSELPMLDGLIGSEQTPLVYDQGLLFFGRYHRLEVALAKCVQRLCAAEPVYPYDLSGYAHLLQDEHQKNALIAASHHNLSIITGGAGTGKTYTLARIISAIHSEAPQAKIALAAPTGKAAQRMQEALQKAFADPQLVDQGLVTDALKTLQPTTIHRLLGVGFHGKPLYSGQMALQADVLVIDEVSMLDLRLAFMLFDAIKSGARIILLGDANQLSSVDVGHILAELQASALLQPATIRLLNSRRFNASAGIGQLAAFVQQQHRNATGLMRELGQYMQFCKSFEPLNLAALDQDVVRCCRIGSQASTHLDELFQGYQAYVQQLKTYHFGDRSSEQLAQVVSSFDSYRILTATKHGELGLHAINQHFKSCMQDKLRLRNGLGEWYLGRPILVTQNDYRLGLSNGDIGICLHHRTHPGEFEVYFPHLEKWVAATLLPSSIQSAFALTIHKSQGSEFEHVAIVLDQSSERLLSQELLYTAITRAKKAVSLLVDERSLISAITTQTVRSSGLSHLLQ